MPTIRLDRSETTSSPDSQVLTLDNRFQRFIRDVLVDLYFQGPVDQFDQLVAEIPQPSAGTGRLAHCDRTDLLCLLWRKPLTSMLAHDPSTRMIRPGWAASTSTSKLRSS